MRTQNRLVEYLTLVTKDDPTLKQVRFSTKKVHPLFKPYPETQVVIMGTAKSSFLKGWQGKTTLLKEELLIMHTYSKNVDNAAEIAELVCELLDGAQVEGIRTVTVNSYPSEIEYEADEKLFYSNIEVLL